MGVVKREGIKQGLVNYVATAIGMVNLLYIYPKFLAPAELGLFQFINQAAMFLTPFSLMGINGLVVKFFPKVRTEDGKHNNFLSLLLLLSLISFAIFFAILYLNQGLLGDIFQGKNDIALKYFGLIIMLVFLMQTNMLLTGYLLNFKKLLVPAIMSQLIKIVIPIAVLLKAYFDWSFTSIAVALFINYALIFVILFVYLAWLGELKFGLDFSFFKGKIVKDMRVFAGFALLGSLGTALALRIDVIMVSGLSTFDYTGIYVIGMAIANVIQIPIGAINSITQPLISEAWHEKDMKEIDNLYKKSSITLLIFSTIVFVLIWISIDDIYKIIPDGNIYQQGKIVVLLLGLAKLFDALTSVNSNILLYSPKFKFNLYFMLVLAVINITLNVILIPRFNIMGAALATMISILSYNVLKFLFLQRQYKLNPFTKQTLIMLLLGLAATGVGLLLPLDFHPIVNMIIRSAIIGAAMVISIYKIHLSEDYNDIIDKALQKIGIGKG